MQLTRAADYGVRVLVHLARVPAETRAAVTQLARGTDVPPAFLSKVLQQLVRTGLVTSYRGKYGGFSLAPGATERTLLDIVTALDGLPPLNDCLNLDADCQRRSSCTSHPVWREAQRALHAVLGGVTLAQLAAPAPCLGHDAVSSTPDPNAATSPQPRTRIWPLSHESEAL